MKSANGEWYQFFLLQCILIGSLRSYDLKTIKLFLVGNNANKINYVRGIHCTVIRHGGCSLRFAGRIYIYIYIYEIFLVIKMAGPRSAPSLRKQPTQWFPCETSAENSYL